MQLKYITYTYYKRIYYKSIPINTGVRWGLQNRACSFAPDHDMGHTAHTGRGKAPPAGPLLPRLIGASPGDVLDSLSITPKQNTRDLYAYTDALEKSFVHLVTTHCYSRFEGALCFSSSQVGAGVWEGAWPSPPW